MTVLISCLLVFWILLFIANILCIVVYFYIRTSTEKYIDEE